MEEKNYGELMSFLLQRRRHHGTEDRFRTYVAESVQTLAKDLREFGLEVSIKQEPCGPAVTPRDFNYLTIGCE
jgi:hypothetical protein